MKFSINVDADVGVMLQQVCAAAGHTSVEKIANAMLRQRVTEMHQKLRKQQSGFVTSQGIDIPATKQAHPVALSAAEDLARSLQAAEGMTSNLSTFGNLGPLEQDIPPAEFGKGVAAGNNAPFEREAVEDSLLTEAFQDRPQQSLLQKIQEETPNGSGQTGTLLDFTRNPQTR